MKIGEGGFGDVYLVDDMSRPGEQYVMKIVKKVILNDEIKVGLTLSGKCPFLVKFKEISMEPGEAILVMEYCSGGDLSKRIKQKKPPADAEIYRFLYETTKAVKTLHDENIIHRDIKPSNIFLLVNGGFKLGDYGMARAFDTELMKTMTLVGTQGYTCPEILRGKTYNSKADIFSLGVTLIEFVIGHNPFCEPGGAFDTLLAIQGTPVQAVLEHPLAAHHAMVLARRMISTNPDLRPSADEILSVPFAPLSSLYPLTLQLAAPSSSPSPSPSPLPPAVTGTGTDIPVEFAPNASGHFKISHSAEGLICDFSKKHSWETVFINKSFTEGILKWNIRVDKCQYAMFGVCASGNIDQLNNMCMNCGPNRCFYFRDFRLDSVWMGDHPSTSVVMSEGSVLSLEVNINRHTLSLNIDDRKVSCTLLGIPVPLHIGVSGAHTTSFTSLSLHRMNDSG